jgi:hypothetical protein
VLSLKGRDQVSDGNGTGFGVRSHWNQLLESVIGSAVSVIFLIFMQSRPDVYLFKSHAGSTPRCRNMVCLFVFSLCVYCLSGDPLFVPTVQSQAVPTDEIVYCFPLTSGFAP